MATDRHAAALVGLFHLDNGRIVEAWFYPEDPDAVLAFFG